MARMNPNYQTPKYEHNRFMGIEAVYPAGNERERIYVHPNAVRIWSGRL